VHLGTFTRDHDSYATVFAWHQMIEAYLRDSGVAWTNLHPNMFMQNLPHSIAFSGNVLSPLRLSCDFNVLPSSSLIR
jgi:NAD(P)H dehydrogenase (quinone)